MDSKNASNELCGTLYIEDTEEAKVTTSIPLKAIVDRSIKEAKIRSAIGMASLVEQMAEESSELAHALLKYSRILRGENPTPVTIEEARANIIEEYTDLLLVADILDFDGDPKLFGEKLERWIDRINEQESDNGLDD